jgi:translation elongation factor EF-Tu-like GTPase
MEMATSFIGGFLMGGIGVTILIYWYNISKSMNDLIIVKAKITMKTTEEGGRQFGFKSGYRPNHVFELPKDLRDLKTYIGDIQFEDQELIEPGETKIVTVRFLNVLEVQKFITVGQKWFINEAAITLGFGEILEI